MKDSKIPQQRSFAARLPFFYGWVVIAVAFVTMGIGVNARTAFSLLYPPILDEFGWGYGGTAAIFSIGFIVSTLATPIVGILMGRFGPRIAIPIGAIMVAAGLVLATWATALWQFYLTLGFLVIGGSMAIGPTLAGSLIESSGGFNALLSGALGCALLSLLLISLASPRAPRRITGGER